MSTDNTNLCCVIHEPEIVTITMTLDQLQLLHTMCDLVRDDDSDHPAITLAEDLYNEISDALTHEERTA